MRRAKVIVRFRRRRMFLRMFMGLFICVGLVVVLWRLDPVLVNFVHSL
jgi:hypothetical protein